MLIIVSCHFFQESVTQTKICKNNEPLTFEIDLLTLQFISDDDGITRSGFMIDYVVDAPSVEGEGDY